MILAGATIVWGWTRGVSNEKGDCAREERTPSEAVLAHRAGLLLDVQAFYTDLRAPVGGPPAVGGDASGDVDLDHEVANVHVGAGESYR